MIGVALHDYLVFVGVAGPTYDYYLPYAAPFLFVGMGWALLAPGRLPRGEALRLAAGRSVQLVAGVILLLVIAAFVEAYWSSMTLVTPQVKYLVGAGLWLLVALYFGLVGRRTHAPD